jgi:peptidoglycan hydrolase-like protein with peptidoglycan-binding domain
MRQSVRRLLFSAGAVTAVAAAVCGQGVIARAAPARPGAPDSGGVTAQSADTYVPPSKPVYYGETGPAVKSVQRRLAQLGYYPGPIDGSFGPDTQEAAWAFREVQGLPMNATTAAEPISRAFEHDLIRPKAPWRLQIKNAPANRVEINQNIEVLVLYKDNKPELITHVSTGGGYYFCNPGGGGCGYAITQDGDYSALSFQSGWVTVPLGTMYNPVWISYTDGYAIHGDIPVPWYPASHGCVRIWMDIAQFFHTLITVGGKHAEPVYIRGTAPYQPGEF